MFSLPREIIMCDNGAKRDHSCEVLGFIYVGDGGHPSEVLGDYLCEVLIGASSMGMIDGCTCEVLRDSHCA